jgi:hypothetical protein
LIIILKGVLNRYLCAYLNGVLTNGRRVDENQ